MSLKEVNKLSPEDKSGGGDGVRNLRNPLATTRRAAVPSCRRFCTRPSPSQKTQSANVKAQLQKAIQDLSQHPNITRRRSFTIAEITPFKNASKNTDGLHLSSLDSRGTGGAKALVAAAPRREEDAGRRVYQLLLLNAWRRRRTQVATLTDSLGALETQKGNLDMQIDALKRLQKAESEKRAQALGEIQILHERLQNMLEENDILREEKVALEEDLKIIDGKTVALKLTLQNTQNDWMTTKAELNNTEHQLGMERNKIRKLREEKQILLDQLSRKEHDVTALHGRVQDLQEKILNTELQLQDTLIGSCAYENEKEELLATLNTEIVSKTNLQKELQELTLIKENLEIKLQDMRKNMNSTRESRKKLEEENQALRKSLADSTEDLKRERQQLWWKAANQLVKTSLNSLKNVAYVMLPAIPTSGLLTPSDCDC